jgi:hypothetical protein
MASYGTPRADRLALGKDAVLIRKGDHSVRDQIEEEVGHFIQVPAIE